MEIRKWKSPILGVAQIVLRDVFLASIFVAYVEPKLFFRFCAGKFSSAAPTKKVSANNMVNVSAITPGEWVLSNNQFLFPIVVVFPTD